jgi:hypothetical protein
VSQKSVVAGKCLVGAGDEAGDDIWDKLEAEWQMVGIRKNVWLRKLHVPHTTGAIS